MRHSATTAAPGIAATMMPSGQPGRDLAFTGTRLRRTNRLAACLAAAGERGIGGTGVVSAGMAAGRFDR